MRPHNIIHVRFKQHYYRVHVMGDAPLHIDIKPKEFLSAKMTERFVDSLDVYPGYWRRLAANCPFHGHDFANNKFSDIDKGRASRLIFLSIIKLYPVTHLDKQSGEESSVSFPTVPTVTGINYTLVPPSVLLVESNPVVKKINDLQQTARFLADLNMEQTRLNELSTIMGIVTTTPKPIKQIRGAEAKVKRIQKPTAITPQIAAMAQKLEDRQFFLLEQQPESRPPRKGQEDLPIEEYRPKPYTLGPHEKPGYVPPSAVTDPQALLKAKSEVEKGKESYQERKQNDEGEEKSVNNTSFKTQHDAAEYVSREINPKSISENREYGGMIYQNEDGTYSYTGPIKGSVDGVNPGGPSSVPKGKKPVAYYHTQGGDDPAYDNENFSKIYDPIDKEWYGDIPYADSNKIDEYLATPKGKFKYYSYKNNQVEFVGDL